MEEQRFCSNGVDIYVLPNPAMHSFNIGVYVFAGSMYEPDSVNGITHLFEHMVFRNLKQKFNMDFYELLVQHGVSFNAYTYKEFLYFEISGLPSGMSFALEILSRLFDPFTLEADAFRIEKGRIKAEIREEDERKELSYVANLEVWKGTSLVNTIAGYCKTLDRISLKRLNAYREEIVSAGNLFIYVTGNVTDSDIQALQRVVSAMPVSNNNTHRNNTAPVPAAFFKRDCTIVVKPSDCCYVRMTFDIDNCKCPVSVRDILYAILFKGENALLYLGLSENRPLVYSYDSTLEQYRNVSCIKFQYQVKQSNMLASVQEVVRILNDIKIGQFPFESNMQKLLTQWQLILDDAFELNWCMAYENHILAEEPICFDTEKLGRYERLTKEQIMACAKDIFVTPNLVVAVKGKKKDIPLPELREICTALDR